MSSAAESSTAELAVLVVGNAVLDLLLRDVNATPGAAADAWADNVQLLAQPIETALGGGGAAAAYVLGRLGQPVVLHSNLGTDRWGMLLRNWLQEAGVRLSEPAAAATAVNIILLTPAGKRHALYYPGESVAWGCFPSAASAADRPDWLLASGYGGVSAADATALLDLFRSARQQGCRVMFDPSPWFSSRISAEQMRALWAETDCLVGTEEELTFWQPADSVEALAASLLDCGPPQVVIKRGGDGAQYAERAGAHGQVSVTPVAQANTVGAGDTFNGRLLYGLCQGESLAEATAAAAQLAATVVKNGRGVLGAFSSEVNQTNA